MPLLSLCSSCLVITLVLALSLCPDQGSIAGPAIQPANGRACLKQLEAPNRQHIGCTLAFGIDKAQQETLSGFTAGTLTDAHCRLAVDMARKTLFAALLNRTHLKVPPQSAACTLKTHQGPLRTTFTLAPDIGFKSGRAVSASPGVAHIKGLPPILATLLRNWVNHSAIIESAMLKAVNGFLEHNLPHG